VEETPVVDLMEALRRSVQQVEETDGKKPRAAAKKPAARPRSRAAAKK
jgi:non-homologous end joining protein Ku